MHKTLIAEAPQMHYYLRQLKLLGENHASFTLGAKIEPMAIWIVKAAHISPQSLRIVSMR